MHVPFHQDVDLVEFCTCELFDRRGFLARFDSGNLGSHQLAPLVAMHCIQHDVKEDLQQFVSRQNQRWLLKMLNPPHLLFDLAFHLFQAF